MNELRRRLILRESAQRLRSAEILDDAGDDADSAYLLRLLSFELLMKVLIEQHTGNPAPKHHKYAELFGYLPGPEKDRLLNIARERIGPSALNEGASTVLEQLGANFIALRYPYDKYADLTEEEYAALGKSWSASGASDERATFRYYPQELEALSYAARRLADG